MKKIGITMVLILLAGVMSVWAQSGGSSGSTAAGQGPTPAKKARTATNSQMMGKGVPYNKESKQAGKSGARKANQSIPPSTVGSESDVANAAKKATLPGSHAAQRDVKAGRKDAPKPRN